MAQLDFSIKDVEKLVKFDGKVKNINISRLTAPGENYVSIVLRVDFEVEENGHSKIVSSVAKCLPARKVKDGFDFHSSAMKNEIKWYSEIVPLLKQFAQENEIKMDFYPEYYGSRYSLDSSKKQVDSDSVLILENLIPQGFKNNDRYIGSDFVTSQAILKKLAIFNALPIAIKIKQPELFQVLKSFCDKSSSDGKGPGGPKDSRGPEGPRDIKGPRNPDGNKKPPGVRREGKSPEQVLLDALHNISDFAPYLSKVELLFKNAPKGMEKFHKLTKEPWNTIAHSDFWVNNIMVNYNKEKEPLIKIVDYQMCSYGSYAKDLVFFLLTSVRNDVVKELMDDLLRLYYDEFKSVLRQANVNLELNYEDYLEEVRITAVELEVEHALTFLPIVFGEKGSGIDTSDEELDPFENLEAILKKMNQYHKDKLLLIASEAIKRKWM